MMSHLLKFNPVLNPKFYFLHSSKTKNCYIYNRLINPFNPYSALLRHQVFNIQIKSIIFYLYLVFPGFSSGTIKISRKTFYKFLVFFLTIKDLITRHICHGDFIQLWICCPVGVKIKFRYIWSRPFIIWVNRCRRSETTFAFSNCTRKRYWSFFWMNPNTHFHQEEFQ